MIALKEVAIQAEGSSEILNDEVTELATHYAEPPPFVEVIIPSHQVSLIHIVACAVRPS